MSDDKKNNLDDSFIKNASESLDEIKGSLKKIFNKENLKKAGDFIKDTAGIKDSDIKFAKDTAGKIKKEVQEKSSVIKEKTKLKNEDKQIIKSVFSMDTLKKTAGTGKRITAVIFGIIGFILLNIFIGTFLSGYDLVIEYPKLGTFLIIFSIFNGLLMMLFAYLTFLMIRSASRSFQFLKPYRTEYQKAKKILKAVIIYFNKKSISDRIKNKLLNPLNKYLNQINMLLKDINKIANNFKKPQCDLYILQRRLLYEKKLTVPNKKIMQVLIKQYKRFEYLYEFLEQLKQELSANTQVIYGMFSKLKMNFAGLDNIDFINEEIDIISNFKNRISECQNDFNVKISDVM